MTPMNHLLHDIYPCNLSVPAPASGRKSTAKAANTRAGRSPGVHHSYHGGTIFGSKRNAAFFSHCRRKQPDACSPEKRLYAVSRKPYPAKY